MTTVSSQLNSVAGTFALTGKVVNEAIERIPFARWYERPADHSNHVLWVVGHLTRTRGLITQQLRGQAGRLPLDPFFAGGQPLLPDIEYPDPEQVVAAWRSTLSETQAALNAAADADLERPSLTNFPTLDGRVGGALAAGIFHESYHVGQLGYLTKWLGYPRLLNR